MTAIARELDEKLKALDPEAAASLEKLVRDALELAEQNGLSKPTHLAPDFFTKIAKEFGSEPFERPPQGELGRREEW